MTKKDYEAVAKIMRLQISGAHKVDITDWSNLCHDLARKFYADNERFSHERFYTACGFDIAFPTTDWRDTLRLSA